MEMGSSRLGPDIPLVPTCASRSERVAPLGRQIALHVLLLAGTLALFHFTEIDLRLQDRLYDFDAHRWLIDRHDRVGQWIVYNGPKWALAFLGTSCAIGLLAAFRSRRRRRWGRPCALTLFSVMLVPLAMAGLKRVTNVYTPDQLLRYGGERPYVKVLGHYPPGFHDPDPGQGYPAAHASGGFCLMMLYFALRGRRAKLTGLAGAIVIGWIMGAYQTLNGQHFLSHTIVAMQLVWIEILLIVLIHRPIEQRWFHDWNTDTPD